MKTCSKCKKNKSLECFNKKSSRKDGLQNYCRDCDNNRLREHYTNNKQYYRDKRNRNRDKYRVNSRTLKESRPCFDCGVFYPYYVMDWDHRDSKGKVAGVSQLVSSGYVSKTKKEIEKCDLVCANCHRIRTFQRLGERSSKG